MRQGEDKEITPRDSERPQLPRLQPKARQYYSVGEVAAVFGVSAMTVYRAIAAGEFPVVKIRSRVIIPIRAVERMGALATDEGTTVDAADWAEPQSR